MKGEPLVETVLQVHGLVIRESDFEEVLSQITSGEFRIGFVRNRMTLPLAASLGSQAKAMAGQGRMDEALKLFAEAAKVDPCDPEPSFQSGMVYLDTGKYGKAVEQWEITERLAPGEWIIQISHLDYLVSDSIVIYYISTIIILPTLMEFCFTFLSSLSPSLPLFCYRLLQCEE